MKKAVISWPAHLQGQEVELVNSPAAGVWNTVVISTGEPLVIHADNLTLPADHGFIALGKYSSARDSILHFLCEAAWSDGSFGDVEAPTGYVWRISNDHDDVAMVNTEFNSVLEEWLEANPEVIDSPALRVELSGHFLVAEDGNGFVSVAAYPSGSLLSQAFDSLEAVYSEWAGDDVED